jgi:hypothetical protein
VPYTLEALKGVSNDSELVVPNDFLLHLPRDVPQEDTENGDNKKGLPGDDHDVQSPSPFTDIINNVLAVDIEVNRHDDKKQDQHVQECGIGFHGWSDWS